MNEPVLTGDIAVYRQSELALTAERMTELHRAATAMVQRQERPNTKLAREQDWKSWETFCTQLDLPTLIPSSDALVIYAAWLATDTADRSALAPTSIVRRVSGVLAGWKRAGIEYPQGIAEAAGIIASGHERSLHEHNRPVGRGKAPALTAKAIRRIVAALPQTPGGIRDRALILIGFGIAARRSELAHLEVSDITAGDEGLSVHVRYSKTKPRHPGVPFGAHEATCPVLAWQAWLNVSGIDSGPAFRTVDRHGRIGGRMTPKAVGEAITRAGALAKLPAHYTGHSVRSGLATESRRAGHDIVTIARQGGWTEGSRSLYGYIQDVDKWSKNAVKGIGL